MASLYDEKVLGAKERIALARKLQEQAGNQSAGQMVSGWYVPNMGGAVSGALKEIMGAWQEKGAKEELDTAERDKNMALARGLMGTGMQIPDDLRSKLATPEQSPSLWERGKAFVTGNDQPQGTPRQEFTEQPVANPTDAQREQAMMQLTTVDPAFAAPLIQQSQFKYSKEQEAQLKKEALAAQQEEHKAQREWREQESERDRIARQDLAKMNIESRADLARLAASLRQPSGGGDGGVAKGWEIVTDKTTGMPVGRVNKYTGQQEQFANGGFGGVSQPQKVKDANEAIQLLNQAAPLVNKSTSSGIGNLYDQALGFMGKSTEGADTAASLKVLGGNLVSKMPKMSGPQSDKDVELYKEMAGKIGDPTIPKTQKIQAMNTINELQSKYAGVSAQPLNFGQQPQPTQPQQGAWGIRPKGQ